MRERTVSTAPSHQKKRRGPMKKWHVARADAITALFLSLVKHLAEEKYAMGTRARVRNMKIAERKPIGKHDSAMKANPHIRQLVYCTKGYPAM